MRVNDVQEAKLPVVVAVPAEGEGDVVGYDAGGEGGDGDGAGGEDVVGGAAEDVSCGCGGLFPGGGGGGGVVVAVLGMDLGFAWEGGEGVGLGVGEEAEFTIDGV